MQELKSIILAFDEASLLGKKTALATVVRVEGSAYRREGARMLIREDGQLTGAISGGCLEGDALRKALLVMVQQKPMLVTYDTTDDDHGIGLQLGCEGIVHLLIEPLYADNPQHPITFFKAIFEKRQATVLATAYVLDNRQAPQIGTLGIFNENGVAMAANAFVEPVVEKILTDKVQLVLERGRSAFFEIDLGGQPQTVFLEYLPTLPKLVVFGAGNDIQPLVKFSDILGWPTTVVDGRPNLAKKERFQQATCVLLAKPEAALAQVQTDENTFFLLMTHNYNYDLAVLNLLLQKKVRYIGILGPKKKYRRMLDELKTEGSDLDENQLPQVFAPIGLDLGGNTPESIALSIVSEIQAVLSKRAGGFLRERHLPIHG